MKLSIAFLSICIGTNTPDVRADMSPGIKTALAIGAACLAGIGIRSLISRYRLTNKQLLTNGEELLIIGNSSRYMASLQGLLLAPTAATLSEELLTAWADHYAILKEIALVVSLLKNHSELLTKRMPTLADKTNPDSESIATTMKAQQRLIEECISDLDGLAQLHDLNRDYFSMISLTRSLLTDYRKELAIVENQTFDYFKTKKKMAKAVIEKYPTRPYPFVSYVEQIDQDRQPLKNKIISGSRYPSAAMQGNELLDKLYTISKIVQAHQNYASQLKKQENDEAERLQLTLEYSSRRSVLPAIPLTISGSGGKEKM